MDRFERMKKRVASETAHDKPFPTGDCAVLVHEDAPWAIAEIERLRAAIEQHRRDYADAIGPQTMDRAEMNRKKRTANQRLWDAIAERRNPDRSRQPPASVGSWAVR